MMPEPLETLRRVLGGPPMDADQLQAALVVLDLHRFAGRADVDRATAEVLDALDRLGVEPAPPADAGPVGGATATASVAAGSSTGVVASPVPRRPALLGTSQRRAVGGGVVALLIAGAVAYGIGRGGPDAPPDGAAALTADLASQPNVPAWDACIQAVAQRLEAPSGAAFGSMAEAVFAATGADVRVSGAVTALDTSGARARSRWVCAADVSPGGQASDVRVLSID
jgi:hypothetical protein